MLTDEISILHGMASCFLAGNCSSRDNPIYLIQKRTFKITIKEESYVIFCSLNFCTLSAQSHEAHDKGLKCRQACHWEVSEFSEKMKLKQKQNTNKQQQQ